MLTHSPPRMADSWAQMPAAVQSAAMTPLIFAGLGIALYSQRASVVDCANQLREEASVSVSTEAAPASGGDGEVTCTFFGQDVTIDLNGG